MRGSVGHVLEKAANPEWPPWPRRASYGEPQFQDESEHTAVSFLFPEHFIFLIDQRQITFYKAFSQIIRSFIPLFYTASFLKLVTACLVQWEGAGFQHLLRSLSISMVHLAHCHVLCLIWVKDGHPWKEWLSPAHRQRPPWM